MLYSSLLKGAMTVVEEDNKCLVDTNKLIAEKLESYKQENKGGFRAGLNAPELELIENADQEEDGTSAILKSEPVYDGPSPEELIAEAREQIARMESDAKAELEKERLQVLEEARQEGFNQGFEDGKREGFAQADSKKRELDEEKERLEKEYFERVEELEPHFVDVLTGIYEHIFRVELGAYRELIVHLIISAMNQVNNAKDYLIHVTKDDFAYVNMQKKEIQAESVAGNATVEIIEDISLRKNECLIETEGGIFDCGLGTQLSELSRKLKLLSYEKDKDVD